MKNILKSVGKFEKKFDEKAERFCFRHPDLAALTMFIILPLLVLLAVAASTAVVAIPIYFISM